VTACGGATAAMTVEIAVVIIVTAVVEAVWQQQWWKQWRCKTKTNWMKEIMMMHDKCGHADMIKERKCRTSKC
jgi:hypothetical protein